MNVTLRQVREQNTQETGNQGEFIYSEDGISFWTCKEEDIGQVRLGGCLVMSLLFQEDAVGLQEHFDFTEAGPGSVAGKCFSGLVRWGDEAGE